MGTSRPTRQAAREVRTTTVRAQRGTARVRATGDGEGARNGARAVRTATGDGAEADRFRGWDCKAVYGGFVF